MTRNLEPLFDRDASGVLDHDAIGDARQRGAPARVLPEWSSLAAFHGGPLRIPLREGRPTVIANFVATLDGVVSFGDPGASGGSAVSGGSAEDRRLMGLLRTLADAVMLGAGTVRRARHEEWTGRDIDPELATEGARVRRELGLTAQPTTVVVTASGELNASQRGLACADVPVVIATTEAGARALAPAIGDERFAVAVLGTDRVDPDALLGTLGRMGKRLVLCEGGPHLLGGLLRDRHVDELFLTLAPQLAGRTAGRQRLALVEEMAFGVADAPWASLVSVRRAGSHLFLRYRFDGSTRENT